MRFKEYYTEGRNRWCVYEIKKTNKRWSLYNTETNKRYFIKLEEQPNSVTGIQKFLMDICATPPDKPKTKGELNFYDFATDVIGGKTSKFYVKSGNWDKIKETWLLDN